MAIERDHDYYRVVDDAIDAHTWAAIVKLQERGVIGELLGPVGQGKEAKVFLAERPGGGRAAVKVYYPVAVRFKRRQAYILGDPRFRGVKVGDHMQMVELWCRKEYGNLASAVEAGVPVPRPLGFYRNVLAMEFVGQGVQPAPTLAEVGLEGLDDPEAVFLELVRAVERAYLLARLVHGDLSEYNVLYSGDVWLIDWGSAVRRGHPRELELLRRDLERLVAFFGGYAAVEAEELYGKLVKRAAARDFEEDGEGWLLVDGERIL